MVISAEMLFQRLNFGLHGSLAEFYVYSSLIICLYELMHSLLCLLSPLV
jgi:hypothetical protein